MQLSIGQRPVYSLCFTFQQCSIPITETKSSMDVTVITSQLTADYFIVTDDQPQWLAMLSGIFKEYQTNCKANATDMSKYKKSLKHLRVWGNTWRYSVMNKGKVTSSVARGVSCGRILITTLLQFIRFTRDSKSLYVIGRWESPECLHSSFIGHQLVSPK